MRFFDRTLFAESRTRVCSQADGDVLEVAVGTGLNLPLYPPGVRLTGIEWSPQMLAIARRRADEIGRTADLREADAQALPFPDAAFDTVVCTLSLCAIPDDQRAIAESRVLKPGGRLLLLDHVPSTVFPPARGPAADRTRHRSARRGAPPAPPPPARPGTRTGDRAAGPVQARHRRTAGCPETCPCIDRQVTDGWAGLGPGRAGAALLRRTFRFRSGEAHAGGEAASPPGTRARRGQPRNALTQVGG
jgi:SAM-dependent methyltransferase